MKHIFVWTFGDILGLGFLALVLVFGAVIGLIALWEKLVRLIRRVTGKSRNNQ